jgi:hypothetical protein
MANMRIRKDQLVLDSGEKMDETLLCVICKNILSSPKNCNNCVSSFCGSCIDSYIASESKCICGAKPENISAAPKLITKLLLKKKFRCCYYPEGCNQLRFYEYLQEHQIFCLFKKVKCTNTECTFEMSEPQTREHQKTCEFNKMACKFCLSAVYVKDRRQHEEKCDQSPAVCPGCSIQLMRSDLFKHVDHCDSIRVECPFCAVGFLRTELPNHDQVECLKSQIGEFRKMSHFAIKDLEDQILTLLEQIQKKDKFFDLICNICKLFSCESQIETCHQCKTHFCFSCSKGLIKACAECKVNICSNCADFSAEKNKCFHCEEKFKRTMSSSFMSLRTNPCQVKHSLCEVKRKVK